MKLQNKSTFAKKFIYKTIISIAIYTTLYILLFYFSYLIFSIRVWEKTDIIYVALNYIRKKTVILWLFGDLIIIIYYWNKIFKYITKIENETQRVAEDDNVLITLPKELKTIESSLNYVKEQSMKNKHFAITEQQKSNELVVSLAHDLKTPLTSIIGYLDLLLQKNKLTDQEQKKYLNLIMNKSLSLQELINELFEITKLNVKDIELKNEEIDILLLLSQTVQDFYPLSISKEKPIKIKKIKEKILVLGDKEKLSRVFNNLIKNALNYSLPKTKIIINYNLIDDNINISIKNQCNKLTQEELSKIFDKFYRCDLSRNSEHGGSGLGLSISKEIIELHNGNIFVNQNNDNTIEFIIQLPILIKS